MNKKFTKLIAAMVFLLFILCIPMGMWGQETWSHTFVSGETISNNSITVNDATWNVSTTSGAGSPTISSGNSYGKYGLQFGQNGSNYFGSVTLSTNYFNSYNVQSVTIVIRNNGTKNGTFSATQGSTTIGTVTQNVPNNSWTTLTVNANSGSGGELSFTYSTTQAFYLNAITVTYTNDPSISISEESLQLPYTANANGSWAVTYSNIEPTEMMAQLYYNSELDNPMDENSWIRLKSIQNPNAIPFEVDANNTAAARPAYLYVLAYNNNNEQVDGVFTITQAAMPTYTVTYNANGAESGVVPTDETQYTPLSNAVIVLGNTGNLAKTGYNWNGWNTQADGSGTAYAANATFNITENVNLYAQWDAKSYNITKAAMTNGDVTVKVGENVVTSATTGATVSLVVTPATDYVLSELTVAKTGDATTTVEVINNQFIMPPYAVTVTATFVEHVAVFTNGVYSEPLTSQESFDNMKVVSTEGDETWVFNSTYNSSFITSVYDEIDWLITPKMVVENGKLNVSFQIYHKNYDGQLSLKWSASNDVLNGEWHNLTFSEGDQNGWRDVNGIVIETEEPYVYVAFVYDNTADDYAGQYQIRNFVAKQYYNVTFNANIANASGSMLPLSCLTNTATPLTANDFSAAGKAFTGWNTKANGSGTSYADGANITITTNTTLYAQWVDAYTVTFTTNGHADGTKTVISGDAIGTLPTPTADFIPTGYDFTGWYNGNLDVNGSSDAPVYIASDYEPTADVTLKAVLAEVVTPAGPETWTKITDLSTVTEGTYALITQTNYAFNGSISDGKGGITSDAFSFENNVAQSAPNGTCELTYISCETGFKMYDANNSRYLYAKAAKTKNLAWHDEENSYWYYDSADENWEYESNSARLRSYDNTNFNTYGNDTGEAIYMAKKTPGTPAVYGNYYTFSGIITTITENTNRTADIPMNEFVTVTNGATLTFSGSNLGTAENLIIEDGGQLDHSNTGVFATMQKGITAHGETVADGGFYFISAPMTSLTIDNTEHTNILSNSDLYIFDQTRELEWQNYKKNNTENHTTFTTLEEGKGYLYANDNTFTALFMGELAYSSDGVVPVSYSTANTDENMHGWNLIGNPFACNAYLTQSYYGIDPEGGRNVVARTGAIAPCEGVMVQAASNQTSVTFSKTAPQSGSGASLQMTIGQQVMNRDGVSSTDIDNAIVSFNEGSELPKFYFMEQNANLYIPQGEKEYAIATSEGQGEMPVNFRANEDGQYTLTVNPEGVEMNYLHLIDNMTGNDIDLLQTPSYTFNAKTTDYESRFRLVFAANNESGVSASSTTFAFYSNGNWMVNNEGEASLQVIDVMGRVLSNQTISGTAELSLNQQPGVYVLRLVNGNDVKTQKIVVR